MVFSWPHYKEYVIGIGVNITLCEIYDHENHHCFSEWEQSVKTESRYGATFIVIIVTCGATSVDKFSTMHYNDVIMTMMASQITSLTVVHLTVY